MLSLIKKYKVAVQMFGADKLYNALKSQYNERFCSGDIIINALIETLNVNHEKMPVTLLIRKLSIIRDPEFYCYYLEDTLDLWIQAKVLPAP